MTEIKDNFGNIIRAGDYVFVACWASTIKRFKVDSITPKGVYLNDRSWKHIKSVVKDCSQELDYLHKENTRLANIEAVYTEGMTEANDGWEMDY